MTVHVFCHVDPKVRPFADDLKRLWLLQNSIYFKEQLKMICNRVIEITARPYGTSNQLSVPKYNKLVAEVDFLRGKTTIESSTVEEFIFALQTKLHDAGCIRMH